MDINTLQTIKVKMFMSMKCIMSLEVHYIPTFFLWAHHRGRQEITEERGISSLTFRTVLPCGMHTTLLPYTLFWKITEYPARSSSRMELIVLVQPGLTKWRTNNTTVSYVILCVIKPFCFFFAFGVSFKAVCIRLFSWINRCEYDGENNVSLHWEEVGMVDRSN